MGVLRTNLIVVTVSLFTLYVANSILNILVIFSPTLSVPLLRSRPILPPNPRYHAPFYAVDQAFDLTVYITRSHQSPKSFRYLMPVWRVRNLTKENGFAATRDLTYTVKRSDKNVFIHAFLSATGKVPDSQSVKVDPLPVHVVDQLVRVMSPPPQKGPLVGWPVPETFRLDQEEPAVMPHGKSKIALQVVHDNTLYPLNSVPADLAYRMNFVQTPQSSYLPILTTDDLFLRRSDWVPLNLNTVNPITVPLHLSISLTSLGMYRLSYTIDAAFDQMVSPGSPFHVSDEGVEKIKAMIFGGHNFCVLVMTVLASSVHLLLDLLALRQEIVHWRKIKSGDERVSKTTLMLNAVCKAVVAGYLYNRREETSIAIVGCAMLTALVNLWKLTKAFRLVIVPGYYLGIIPAIRFNPSGPWNIRPRIADKVDAIAIRYMFYIFGPLAVGSGMYGLVFRRYHGFYSWTIDTLMAVVVSFEIIQMVPQIVLNHSLHTVEILPLTAYICRAANTFVDYMSAFVIPMPKLTRISSFHNDVVMTVLLVQWSIYNKGSKVRKASGRPARKVAAENDEKIH